MIITQQTHKENPQLKSHCDIEDREMPVLPHIAPIADNLPLPSQLRNKTDVFHTQQGR